MEVFAAQLGIVLGVLAACFTGPSLALVFLWRRKRTVRSERRSPIAKDLLRGPGHSLRGQLDALLLDVSFELVILMVVPLMMLTVFLGQAHVIGMPRVMRLAPIYAFLAIGFIAWTTWKLAKAGVRLDNLKAGYDAELAVGQELDQLMRHGAAVFHDFPAERFNIDHVVVSRHGVFAVETKGYTKPKRGRGRVDATVTFDGKTLRFPTWTTSAPLEQTARQAAWLSRWLTAAVGAPVSVLPALALPGWLVERTGRGDVRVFNGKELSGLLTAKGANSMLSQQVQQVAHQLEQRCRTVAPLYNETSKLT